MTVASVDSKYFKLLWRMLFSNMVSITFYHIVAMSKYLSYLSYLSYTVKLKLYSTIRLLYTEKINR